MSVHNYHYRPRQSNGSGIAVIPSSPDYFERMTRLHQVGYGYDAAEALLCKECLTPEKFESHFAVFPEGQFIAVDTATQEVVGLTVSMQINFDPNNPFLGSWVETTGWG